MRERRPQLLSVALGLGLALSIAASWADSEAGSESGGFFCSDGESESGGVLNSGGYSESGGPYRTGAATESGGFYGSGGHTESGGAYNSGGYSESGGPYATGASTESGGFVPWWAHNSRIRYHSFIWPQKMAARPPAPPPHVPEIEVKNYSWPDEKVAQNESKAGESETAVSTAAEMGSTGTTAASESSAKEAPTFAVRGMHHQLQSADHYLKRHYPSRPILPSHEHVGGRVAAADEQPSAVLR
jgi:hypothetical protein